MIRDAVIDILLGKFDLCCTKLFQLKKPVNAGDKYQVLTEILREIVDGKIKSPHVNEHQASTMLAILEYVEASGIMEGNPRRQKIARFIDQLEDKEFGGDYYG